MLSVPPDAAEFERLFRAHAPGLLRLACRLLGDTEEARDVVQELFVRLWTGRDGWDAAEGARKSYLYTAVRRRALDRLKHRRIVQRHETKALAHSDFSTTAPCADGVALDTELRVAITQAIAKLPLRQRTAVELRFLQQLTSNEVADVMGISPNTVRVHLERALVALRVMLKTLLVLSGMLGIT